VLWQEEVPQEATIPEFATFTFLHSEKRTTPRTENTRTTTGIARTLRAGVIAGWRTESPLVRLAHCWHSVPASPAAACRTRARFRNLANPSPKPAATFSVR
jgi:hypothetical protein